MRRMLNLGSATLQEFNTSFLYGKKFSFKDYDEIICYQSMIQLIDFSKKAYHRQRNLKFVNSAVSDYTGTAVYKFQQNQGHRRTFDTIGLRHEVVGSAGTIQKNNMTPRLLKGRIQQRLIQVDSIESVIDRWNITSNTFNVLKLDVQGSEYPILRWLLNNNELGLFKEIYIQFHLQLFNNDPKLKKLQMQFYEQCEKLGINIGRQD